MPLFCHYISPNIFPGTSDFVFVASEAPQRCLAHSVLKEAWAGNLKPQPAVRALVSTISTAATGTPQSSGV